MCHQLYKNLKYLPCHHSYCEKCLEKLQIKSKVICPECRAESAVPAGGVKDLPADFCINSMMDEMRLKCQEDDEVLKCNECIEDEPIVAYCQTCSSHLCQFCHENHKRSKTFLDHKTATVVKLEANKNVNIEPKDVFLTCKEHDKELLFYCDTCEQLVCKHCVVMRHYGHIYTMVRIKGCKCQIESETTAPVKMVVEDLPEVCHTIDEMKKVRVL